mgnify:FL=1
MIDTDKYEGCIADMKGYDLAILAEELLAEVKRLREVIREIKELSEGWLRWDERGIKMAKIIMEMIE